MSWSLKNPLLVMIVVVLVTAFAAFKTMDIRIDASTEGMMIERDPAKLVYQDTLKKFGSDNITVVYIKDKSLFTPDKLKKLEDIVYALKDVPGVTKVESLFSVTNFKGGSEGLETNPLMDRPPVTIEEAKRIQADAIRNPNLRNSLISKDGTTTAINLYLDLNRNDKDSNTKFSKKVDSIVTQYKGYFDQLFQFGISYGRRSIAENIMGDMLNLVPLAVIILILTVIIALRSLTAGIMPVLSAGITTIWTFGFMAVTGIPLNVLTVIVPALLIVIGSTEDIHMVSEYLEGIEESKGNRDEAIRFMAVRLGLAVFFTSLVTFIGFASTIINDITMLVQFGYVAAFSLFINPLVTFTMAPAFLHYFGPRKVRHHEGGKIGFIETFYKKCADFTLYFVASDKRRKYTAIGVITVLIIFSIPIFSVKVDNDFLAYFKKGSDIRQRSTILHQELSGAQTFYIHITSGVAGTFKQAEYLSQVARIEQYMMQKGWVDKTQSLADQIALINREMNKGDPKFFSIPNDPNLISQYLLLLSRDDIERFVTSDFSETNIMVRHNIGSSSEINAILEDLDKYIKKTVNPNFKVVFTGEYILINKAAESLVWNSVSSIATTIVLVYLCMYFLFWSWKAGIISLLPNLFPIVIFFGIMGLFNIPLNVGTAMVADIAIGIAIDDTVHFMANYYRMMREHQDTQAAVEASVRSQIRPVVSSSIALALAFTMVMVSNFVPVIQFGMLSAIVMVVAIFGELLILPGLLCSIQLITIWDMVGLKLQDAVIKTSPFFDGLRHWQRKKVCLLGKIVERNVGEKAVVQGEFGKSMFLLLEGQADVIGKDDKTGREIIFAKLNPGDIFGEIALVEPGPRSANILALEPIKYLEIDWEGLKRIQKVYPRIGGRLFLNLSRILGQRLVNADKLLLGKM